MSGDTASFLAGGEIPIPSPQSTGGNNTVITVVYQQFGISLAFTPTILSDGVINLVVKPEVSSIDPTNGITEDGIVIPGLKVRRASTTVELRDGESFTIAGLLSDSYQNTINAFPFLGDVPVLGALFRSPNFQSDQTELVIVVTPHLVTARRGPVALPTDHFTPPSDYELFLFGMLAGQGSDLKPEDRALMSQDPAKGGVEGPYGHVLY
jgi:pilus assembly protein CpaC